MKTQKKSNKCEEIDKMLMNLEEMLNHEMYCLFIQMADMRSEIKKIRINLFDLMESRKNE